MKFILKLFLIAVFVIGTLNFTYANGGPIVGENQAEKAAQNYLNSNNFPYIATIPGWDSYRYKVKDIETGKVKWVTEDLVPESETLDSSTQPRYKLIDPWPTWIVKINDKNGRNVGKIYVDGNIGQILKVVINGKVLLDIIDQRDLTYNLSESFNTELETNYHQNTLDKTTAIILALVSILIIASVGFWFNNRKT